MIIQAVSEKSDRKGTSIPAIRKYLVENFNVSTVRLNQAMKLLKAVDEEGWLQRTAGKGASSGSHFKLPAKDKKKKQKEDVAPKPELAAPKKRKSPSKDKKIPEKKKRVVKEKAADIKKKVTRK